MAREAASATVALAVRDRRRRWDAEHPENVAAAKAKYRAAHPDRVNALARASAARVRERKKREAERARARQAARQRRRDYNHQYYLDHRDEHRAAGRRYVERQLVADPVGFRARRNENHKRYYERHRDELTRKARDRYHADRARQQEYARQYYLQHADQVKARRRERYRDDPERHAAYMRQWRAREKRRTIAGLPPRRLRTVTSADRDDNLAAATAFFTRQRTAPQLDALQTEAWTPDDLLQQWGFQSLRVRADLRLDTLRNQLEKRRAREDARLLAERLRRQAADAADRAETARLDEIGRAVNARLRTTPAPRRHGVDPATTFPFGTAPTSGGLNR